MKSKMRYLLSLIFIYLALVTLTGAQIRMPVGPTSSPESGINASNVSDWLTPEILGMRRSSMEFGDIPVRFLGDHPKAAIDDQVKSGHREA